jgi:hypothetical protein
MKKGIPAAAMAAVLLVCATAHAQPLADHVQRAAMAPTDAVRLELLKGMRDDPQLSDEDAADLERVIHEVERWVSEPYMPYFDRPFLKGGVHEFGIAPDSPFRPLELFYHARMHLWVTLEYGGYWSDSQARRARLDESRQMFEQLAELFPGNALIGMYLGTPIPPEKTFEPVAGAPDWAVYQREGIERLADIITWWIDHRQRDDGQYGGGWGDDCEMWRWWVPVLIAFEDPKITAAQARLSRGLFAQKHMQQGYTDRVHDVEHTAEDSADTITPMMFLAPHEREWQDRALRLAELMEHLWTGRNERGRLQYKSTYFSVNTVDGDPRKACDTVYHPRAVQPALLYWQRTGDPRLGNLFTDWLDTWVDAAAREERGKPAGIIPSAIHWPGGTVGGTGAKWWDPENHSADPLYVWPSAMTSMTNTLLLAYHMTNDEKYLAPLRSMAALRLQYLENPPAAAPEPGSAMWCAAKMGFLRDTLAKYRLLTGSTEFDALLRRENAPYLAFRIQRDPAPMLEALRQTAEALRFNFPGYTSEVRYTDRVLRFPALFQANGMFPDPVPGIHVPDPGLLYATATGDPGNAGYFPLNAVRWLTPPREIAALVTDAGTDRFEARLFHFGEQAREMAAELYMLKPGLYSLTMKSTDGEPLAEARAMEVRGAGSRVAFKLPAQIECVWSVRLIQAIDHRTVTDSLALPRCRTMHTNAWDGRVTRGVEL